MSSPYPNELPRNDVEFIRIGFNDACINFKVWFHSSDFDQLKLAVKGVTEYNEFRGAKVAKAIEKIEHLLRSAEFGREMSPVLYLEFKSEVLDKQVAMNQVHAAFKPTDADEFDTRADGRLRLWWD